jgi:hypothetical protein
MRSSRTAQAARMRGASARVDLAAVAPSPLPLRSLRDRRIKLRTRPANRAPAGQIKVERPRSQSFRRNQCGAAPLLLRALNLRGGGKAQGAACWSFG